MTPHIVEGADPTPLDFQTEIYRKGLHYEKPPLTFRTDQWEIEARKTLDSRSWGYVNGNAGTGQTYRNNLQEFQKWAFVPKRLVPSGFPDLSVEPFGKKYPYPLALAPIGVQRIFHSDGEHAVAQAAAAEHVPYIYSTAASTSIEDAALSNGDGHRWYQASYRLHSLSTWECECTSLTLRSSTGQTINTMNSPRQCCNELNPQATTSLL